MEIRRAIGEVRKPLGYALFLWVLCVAFVLSNQGELLVLAGALVGFGAYIATLIAVAKYGSARSKGSPSEDIPGDVVLVLLLWIAGGLAPLLLRRGFWRGITEIYEYAATHGWFVAKMFILGLLVYAFTRGKTASAESKVMFFSATPVVAALASYIMGPDDGAGGEGPIYLAASLLVVVGAGWLGFTAGHDISMGFRAHVRQDETSLSWGRPTPQTNAERDTADGVEAGVSAAPNLSGEQLHAARSAAYSGVERFRGALGVSSEWLQANGVMLSSNRGVDIAMPRTAAKELLERVRGDFSGQEYTELRLMVSVGTEVPESLLPFVVAPFGLRQDAIKTNRIV